MYPNFLPASPMSNWQAAEEGDLQDDFDLELDAQTVMFLCTFKVLFYNSLYL